MQLLGKGAGKGTGQGLGVKAFGLWFRMALEGVRGGVLEVSPVLVELFVDFRSEGRACEKLVQTGTDFPGWGSLERFIWWIVVLLVSESVASSVWRK